MTKMAEPAPRSLTGLRPCPFCGSVRLSSITLRDQTTRALRPLLLQCNDCGATGPIGKSLDEIRRLWDVRAQEV